MPRTTVTQSIAFQPEVLAAIKAAAEREERSVSWIVNRYLSERLLGAPAPISTDMPAPAKAKRKRGG